MSRLRIAGGHVVDPANGVDGEADVWIEDRFPPSWAVYLTIGLSGACALGAEVIWTRLLGMMLGSTVYVFSIILAVFLTGLAIGSAAGSWARAEWLSPARSAATAKVGLTHCGTGFLLDGR